MSRGVKAVGGRRRPRVGDGGRARRGGFTLLEMLIAMTFVILVASGIVLSITTAFRVWKLTQQENEINQEARAIMELLSRDLRGSYLGMARDAGFFIGGVQSAFDMEAGSTQAQSFVGIETGGPTDPLFLTTESTSGEEVSFLPGQVQREWNQEVERPVSDMVAVRWEWHEAVGQGAEPSGLYRTTSVILHREPESQPEGMPGAELGRISSELISESVLSLRFRYSDGEDWVDAWDSREQENKLPQAVAIELELAEPGRVATGEARGVSNSSARGERKHLFRNVVTLAMR